MFLKWICGVSRVSTKQKEQPECSLPCWTFRLFFYQVKYQTALSVFYLCEYFWYLLWCWSGCGRGDQIRPGYWPPVESITWRWCAEGCGSPRLMPVYRAKVKKACPPMTALPDIQETQWHVHHSSTWSDDGLPLADRFGDRGSPVSFAVPIFPSICYPLLAEINTKAEITEKENCRKIAVKLLSCNSLCIIRIDQAKNDVEQQFPGKFTLLGIVVCSERRERTAFSLWRSPQPAP